MPQSLTAKQLVEQRPQTGLLTEVNPLDFPEGASVDERNFVLNRKGERQRRLGMDIEDLGVLTTTGLSDSVTQDSKIATFTWNKADWEYEQSLLVVAIGSQLWFFDGGANTTSLVPRNSGNPVTLIGGTGIPLQFAAIANELYVANGSQVVHILSYDSVSDSVSTSQGRLEIRDLFGLEDGFEVSERPTTNPPEHNYNLRNQGWPQAWKVKDSGGSRKYPPAAMATLEGVYPSNADIWHLGLVFDATRRENIIAVDDLLYDNTGEAAKGHYIIDAFRRGASRNSYASEERTGYVSVPTNFPADETTGGLRTIAAYAGRVWYAVQGGETDTDAESPYMSTLVLYSQVVDSKTDALKCYTRNDPTSKDFSDVLATDGGFIRLPEARGISALVPVADSLLVFAENGVWQIRGGDGGFSATEQAVVKISSSGATSPESIVNADGQVFFIGESGIYAVQSDPAALNLVVENITENTIQTFFNEIPSVSRIEAKGYFDSDNRTVRWLYNSGESWYQNGEWSNRYNRELVLDTLLPAWYIHDFADDATTSSPGICGYIETDNFVSAASTEVVTDSSGATVTSGGADVSVTDIVRSVSTTRRKYITLVYDSSWKIAFSFYRNADFRDFPEYTNRDASAYLVSGYAGFGDSARKNRVPYLTVHMRRTEDGFEGASEDLQYTAPSSCKVQAQWDFTNSANAGRWGSEFQAYRLLSPYVPSGTGDSFDYSYTVVTTKNKLRGWGRALSLKFSSEPDKDLQLLGWNYTHVTNEEV